MKNQPNNTAPDLWPDLNAPGSWPDIGPIPQLDITAGPPLDLTAPGGWPEFGAEMAAERPQPPSRGNPQRKGKSPGKRPEMAANDTAAGSRRMRRKKARETRSAGIQPGGFIRQTSKQNTAMFTQEITPETPLVQMTAGQLAEYLNARSAGAAQPGTGTAGTPATGQAQPRRYVYGIKGIMQLFGVSNVTAQRYKRGIIREAVSQNGRIIVVDEEKALQLFKERKGAE